MSTWNVENRTTASGTAYDYKPPADSKWKGIIEELYEDYYCGTACGSRGLGAMTAAPVLSQLTGWKALPRSQCAGDNGASLPEHCIPFIGLEFTRIGNVCMFSLG